MDTIPIKILKMAANDEKKNDMDTLAPQHLIFSEAGLEIVTNPFLVGDSLQKLAQQSSIDFLKYINANTLPKPIACLNILRGGRYYQLIEVKFLCLFSNFPIF